MTRQIDSPRPAARPPTAQLEAPARRSRAHPAVLAAYRSIVARWVRQRREAKIIEVEPRSPRRAGWRVMAREWETDVSGAQCFFALPKPGKGLLPSLPGGLPLAAGSARVFAVDLNLPPTNTGRN